MSKDIVLLHDKETGLYRAESWELGASCMGVNVPGSVTGPDKYEVLQRMGILLQRHRWMKAHPDAEEIPQLLTS